jgi:hypothetical protein
MVEAKHKWGFEMNLKGCAVKTGNNVLQNRGKGKKKFRRHYQLNPDVFFSFCAH